MSFPGLAMLPLVAKAFQIFECKKRGSSELDRHHAILILRRRWVFHNEKSRTGQKSSERAA
jgi:hypothetical protein